MSRLYSLDLSETTWPLIRLITNDNVTNGRITSVLFSIRENRQRLVEFIALFRNIRFLKALIRGDPDSVEWRTCTEALIGSLSNLKGLDFYDGGCGIEWKILQSVGHHLEYLTLHDPEHHFYRSAEQKQIDFVNLRQLRQGDCCVSNCIRIIMKTAVHLEKVRIFDECDLLADILTQCGKLKYLEIDAIETVVPEGLEDVLQTLERSLFSSKTIQRDTFKIRIDTSFAAVIECKEYISKLNRIINLFSENHVDQWMLIIHIENIERKKEKNGDLIYDLEGSLTSDISKTRVLHNENQITVVIANPQCTFCGWRESWLLDV